MTDAPPRWELVITAEAEVIPGDPQPDTDEDDEEEEEEA